MIKFPVVNKGVTLTEIPNRIAVFFEIGNCTCKCEGCHSPELWSVNQTKNNMTAEEIIKYTHKQYKRGANAVLFMGGLNNEGVNHGEFYHLLEKLNKENIQIGLYSGDTFESFDEPSKRMIKNLLTWLKVGSYVKELGGLNSPTTNQKFYERATNGILVDRTKRYFQNAHFQKVQYR